MTGLLTWVRGLPLLQGTCSCSCSLSCSCSFFILLLPDRKLKDVSTTVVSFSKQQQQIPNLLRSDRTHGQSEVKDQGRAALGRMCCIHGG